MKKIVHLTSNLHTANFQKKRVFLRADLNVPIHQGTILSDYRLKAILPTIDLIQKKGGKIILATHLGRPKNQEKELSTALFISWFEKRGYSVEFESNLEAAYQKSFENTETILLLENLRFFPGEKDNNSLFAQSLALLGNYYVNDAFALLHRTDTSIIDVPALFGPKSKTIGLVIEKELAILNEMLEQPQHPFMLILGGAKISDKLPLLKRLLNIVDTILLCPAIVFTFLKAQGLGVGKSLVDDNLLTISREIMDIAKEKNVKLLFPIDYQTALNTFDGKIESTPSTKLANNQVGISIGPETEALFANEISKTKTIFFNGAIGDSARKKTLKGMLTLFSAMAKSNAKTIIGGGDTISVAEKFDLMNKLSYCSTGGGATLAYLAGEKLPGLQLFLQ